MGDILKEAIADAKAVRETALQNAKMALEEAFTPQLKSMLSAKLREDDLEDNEEIPAEEDEFGAEEEEVPADEIDYSEVDMDEDEVEGGEDEVGEDEGEEVEVPEPADEISYDEEEEEPVAETLSINGRTYRLAEDEEEEVPADEMMATDEEEEDNLDLESVIKELEDELEEGEEEEEDPVTESEDGMEGESDQVEGDEKPEHVGGSMDETFEIDTNLLEQEDENDVDEEDGTVEEQSGSSNVGSGDNKVDVADASDEEDPEGAGVHKQEFSETAAELKEYKQAVKFLKDKLHEVNILNAKLLFTNKLFKSFSLNNNQKLKVVETFDRAQTTREIKLVYATLCESFGNNSKINRKKSINESASSKSGSTKPVRKVISEESNVANRFKKLAGLKG
jgi:hypothetical protein